MFNINLRDFASGPLRYITTLSELDMLRTTGFRAATFLVYRYSYSATVFESSPGATDIERATHLSHAVITAANCNNAGDASGVSAPQLLDAMRSLASDVSPRVVQDLSGPVNDRSMWWTFVLPMLWTIIAKMQPGGWGFVTDIKSGYLSVMLGLSTLLTFGTSFFGMAAVRTRLALGYILAPAIFCTITAEAIATTMRTLYARCPSAITVDWAALSCYIDDFIGSAATRASADLLHATLRAYLAAVGFVESIKKAQEVSQLLKLLGVMLCLKTCRIYLPEDKARALLLLVCLVKACAARKVTGSVRQLLAKLAGSLSAVCAVVPAGRLHMAAIHAYAADERSASAADGQETADTVTVTRAPHGPRPRCCASATGG